MRMQCIPGRLPQEMRPGIEAITVHAGGTFRGVARLQNTKIISIEGHNTVYIAGNYGGNFRIFRIEEHHTKIIAH